MKRTSRLAIAILAPLAVLAATAGVVDASEGPAVPAGPVAKTTSGAVDEAAGLFTVHELDPGYARVAVDYNAQQVNVLWKGDVPAAILDAVADAKGLGVQVEISDAPYSEDDINEAAARIIESNPDTVSVVLANEDRTGLIVEVESGSKTLSTEAQSAATFARTGGIPVEVRAGHGKPVPASRQNMGAPFKGGGAIAYSGGVDYCTTGFAVTVAGGQGRLLSAYHCNNAVGAIIRDGVGGVIGPVSDRNAALDSELIDPDASPATIGKAYSGPWTSTGLRSVAGAVAPADNQLVCTSGSNSGEHCDQTVLTGASWSCNGTTCTGFVSYNPNGGVAAAQGDSGGPVYGVRTDDRLSARGIISGISYLVPCGPTAEPTNCGAYAYSISITRILANWNAAIEVQP